ncbi:MAG: metallophosphoesterase [bacterium]
MNYFLTMAAFIVVLFATEYYFTRKVSKAIKNLFPNLNEKKFKLWKRFFLFYFNLYPILALFAWLYILMARIDSFGTPENFFFDYFILYPFWILIILVIQTLIFFLPIDIIKLITFPLWKSIRERIKRIEAFVILIIAGFFIVYVPARFIYDYYTVEVRRVEYVKKNLHPDLEEFKIGFIGDIHADYYTNEARLSRFVNMVSNEKPDIVLIAGDLITGTPNYIETSANYLGKIKSKYGIYSCVGDHDNWAYRFNYVRSLAEIKTAMSKANVVMPDNEKMTFNVEDAKIEIAFITNNYVNRVADQILDSLTNGIEDRNLKIFLTHQPRQFLIDEAVKKNFDLFLAGHTHGGQITFLFPFINPSITLIETKYVKGDFFFGDMMMTVTRGLGMSLAPVRYNSTPEITIITLKNKSK